MFWSAEEYVVLLTGVLFLALVAGSFLPGVELTRSSLLAFGLAGVVFVGAAVVLARVESAQYLPLVWVLPVVPLLVIGVLARDAVVDRRHHAQPERVSANARPEPGDPLAASTISPAEGSAHVGGGEGSPRALAADSDSTPTQLAEIAMLHPELRATVARNPATPSSVLDWLAGQDDPVVMAAIASRQPRAAS